ncbi:MAG: tetraacyldisaccharide 4'-kinase [Rickettsiales bacterium]|nr:tetraacyldisaccharide 4'-kinase [Rickettsiales bacterium]
MKKNLTAYLLWPLSVIYTLVSKIVFLTRARRQTTDDGRHIICVGGLLAGGVGKTPAVYSIAKYLPKSAIVMRGYRGKKSGRVAAADTASDVGDEAKMQFSAGLPVFVGADRNVSIANAAGAGFANIIMDDGFQNPTVRRDLSIVVFNGDIGVGNGFVLPAGPLRETLRAGLRRANAVLIMGDDKTGLVKKIRAAAPQLPVFYAALKEKIPAIKNKNIIVFSGIGYPEKFFARIRGEYKNKSITATAFADHHQYTNADIENLLAAANAADAALITTEKDWVRLPAGARKKIAVAKLETTIEPKFWRWLDGYDKKAN